MNSILLLNGPNLNLLGQREPGIYGATSLEQIEQQAIQFCDQHGLDLQCFQSNAEHQLIDKIQAAANYYAFIVFNPAAFTHTSVAIRDALLAVDIPFVEVHLSNPHAREPFRHTSYFSDIAQAVIAGCGAAGYRMALEFAEQYLKQKQTTQ